MKKRLSLFGFFTLTASMLMSADEYPAFAQSGLMAVVFLASAALIWFLPVALCSAEMATMDGNENGGVFTWVKGALGERAGFVAVTMQWLQNTINFITMLYFIIGALSVALSFTALNTNPWFKYLAFLLIFWALTLSQLGGIGKTDRIVKVCFLAGIVLPSLVFLVLAATYLFQGHQPQIQLGFQAISFQGFSLSSFVPFILAFAGIEASASYANEMDKPKRDYPLALLLLVVFAVVLDALGGLAVGLVVPGDQLSMNAGVLQAVQIALQEIVPALGWVTRVMAVLLALGMIGEVSSWVVGPVRTLFAAAQDGLLPSYFAVANENKVPVRLVLLQGAIVTVIGGVLTLLFGGNNGAFKIAMSLTVMMYMVTYALIFVAYLKLLLAGDKTQRDFEIPGGVFVRFVVAALGLVSTAVVFAATFIPSVEVAAVMGTETYVLIMAVLFLAVLCGVLLLYQREERGAAVAKPIKHRKLLAEEVNRFIFPKGRSYHWFAQETDDRKGVK